MSYVCINIGVLIGWEHRNYIVLFLPLSPLFFLFFAQEASVLREENSCHTVDNFKNTSTHKTICLSHFTSLCLHGYQHCFSCQHNQRQDRPLLGYSSRSSSGRWIQDHHGDKARHPTKHLDIDSLQRWSQGLQACLFHQDDYC